MTVAAAFKHLSKHGTIRFAGDKASVKIGTCEVFVTAYDFTDLTCPIAGCSVVKSGGSSAGIYCEHLTRAIKYAESTATD